MSPSSSKKTFDVVIVGGGPAGATAANDLARQGRHVLLLDKAGRIKPCGGAIPPRLIAEFEIPGHLLVARISAARMVSPSNKDVDMPIDGGFVGMVDREHFDEWLRTRAAAGGAVRRTGTFHALTRDADGTAVVSYERRLDDGRLQQDSVRARADGAVSAVARQCIPQANEMRYVFAYHEIIRSPSPSHPVFDATRCDVVYRGQLSPDFYSWVFPHGPTTSIGTGSACKGFSLRGSVAEFRKAAALDDLEPVLVQLQVLDDAWIEQAHRVGGDRVAEAGVKLLGHRGAADQLAAFDHVHAQSRHGEIGRASQAVMAGTDDDDVGFVHVRFKKP